jgi:hypothetical protein
MRSAIVEFPFSYLATCLDLDQAQQEAGMAKKEIKTSGAGGEVQVFELTMDNTEDQDELNRRLRKPGEPGYVAPPK